MIAIKSGHTPVGGRAGRCHTAAVGGRAERSPTAAAAAPNVVGGAVVQPMIGPGTETITRVVQDPSFGPPVMFGLGGVATDLLGDVSFRVLPLTQLR
jgi:acyl-CoA synthetase (NDP forming)